MFGSKAREDGRFNYVCNASSGEDRHTVAASGTAVDEKVDKLVLAYIQKEAVEGKRRPAKWKGEKALAEVDGKIEKLMDAFMAGTLSEDTVFPRVEALEAERARMRQSRAEWLASTTGPAPHRETAATWEARGPDGRRVAADRVLRAMYVRPATRRSGAFDPERLVPVWRADPQDPDAAPA